MERRRQRLEPYRRRLADDTATTETFQMTPEATMQHFNNLTPAEAERLAMLAEECGEVIQAVGKILRHGYDSHHPDQAGKPPEFRHTNRDQLKQELADLLAVVDMMDQDHAAIDAAALDAAFIRKMRYAHHQSS